MSFTCSFTCSLNISSSSFSVSSRNFIVLFFFRGGGGGGGSGTNCRTQGVLTVLFGFFAETPPPLHLVLETNCF